MITTLKAVVGSTVGVYVGASGEGTSVVGASVVGTSEVGTSVVGASVVGASVGVGTSVGAPVEDYYVYIIINEENKL